MSEEINKAGLLVRTIAKIIDFIIIAAAAEVIPKAGFYAGLAYLLICDGLFGGSSIGKKLIGLKVVSAKTYQSCTFKDSIVRNCTFGIGYFFYQVIWLGWIVTAIISVLEFIILLGSKDEMRLGDELAGTIVLETHQVPQEA